jgi:hypothetical protein
MAEPMKGVSESESTEMTETSEVAKMLETSVPHAMVRQETSATDPASDTQRFESEEMKHGLSLSAARALSCLASAASHDPHRMISFGFLMRLLWRLKSPRQPKSVQSSELGISSTLPTPRVGV